MSPIRPDGNALAVNNDMTNFGWEYVWHCHLLGHEEMDMMRPIVFQVSPAVPSGLAAIASTLSVNPPTVALSWIDNATNPVATNFQVQRATDALFTQKVTMLPPVPVGQTTQVDTPPDLHTQYFYQVRAENTVSYSLWSNAANATTAGQLPAAPTGLGATLSVDLTWTAGLPPGGPVTSYQVQRALVTGGVTGAFVNLTPTTALTTFSDTTASPGTAYAYQVLAANADGSFRSIERHYADDSDGPGSPLRSDGHALGPER